jgi:hypothetical protein
LKCVGTRAETRFRLSAKRTSPFISVGASVQSTTSSRGVRISGSNAGYNMFRGSVKSTGYPLHSPVSPSLPLPCVTVCHHLSTGLYNLDRTRLVLLFYYYCLFHVLFISIGSDYMYSLCNVFSAIYVPCFPVTLSWHLSVRQRMKDFFVLLLTASTTS